MEDVLSVYTRPREPDRTLVRLDETSKQLVAETRLPVAMQPGRPARIDREYERNGTANLFMMFAPIEGWRHVKVTDRRTAIDYAQVLKDLADVHLDIAETIELVKENLNTHVAASLYRTFPAAEARRFVERFEWHYTPKHGSWRNLAASELGVLAAQRLDRRIPYKPTIPARSPPGSRSETLIAPSPIGASQPRTLASNSRACIPSRWMNLGARLRIRLRPERRRSSADQAQASMDQWASRTHEPHHQGRGAKRETG